MKNVAVIGSGVSGLSFAYYAASLDPEMSITIFEKNPYIGGYIQTSEKHPSVKLEKGPRTLRSVSDGSALIVDLFVRARRSSEIFGVRRTSPANRKYLLNSENKLVEVPSGLGTFWHFFFGNTGLNKGLIRGILSEPFRPLNPDGNDESIESFMARRLGNGLCNIASALYHGIYAGDVAKLGAASVIPAMFDVEKKAKKSLIGYVFSRIFSGLFSSIKSVFKGKKREISADLQKYEAFFGSNLLDLKQKLRKYPIVCFENGMSSVTELFYELLQSKENVTFRFNSEVESLVNSEHEQCVMIKSGFSNFSFDYVVSTVSPEILSQFVDWELSKLLAQSQHCKVGLVNIYIDGVDLLEKSPGFGYLVPKSYYNDNKDDQSGVLGVIFDSYQERYKQAVFSASEKSDTVVETSENFEKTAQNAGKIVKNAEKVAKTAKKPYTKLTVMMGGHYWDSTPIPSAEKCVEMAKSAVKNSLSIDVEAYADAIVEFSLTADSGIPQYTVGYKQWEKTVRSLANTLYDGRLVLSGMAFNAGSIGVPDCVANSWRLAAEAASHVT